MQSGKRASRALVDKSFRRIDAIDRSGPALHSVIEIIPKARETPIVRRARQTDAPRPMHGIPV